MCSSEIAMSRITSIKRICSAYLSFLIQILWFYEYFSKSRPGILLSKESNGLSEGSPCGHERGGAGKCDGKSHLTMFKHYWLTQTKCRSRSHHAHSIIRTIVLHFCLPRPSDRHKSVQPLVRFQCAPLSLCLSGDIILPHRCVDNRELYALRRSAGGSPGAPS